MACFALVDESWLASRAPAHRCNHSQAWQGITRCSSFLSVLGALTLVDAILGVRTARGAVAWRIAEHVPLRCRPGVLDLRAVEFRGVSVLRRKTEGELTEARRQVARDLLAMRATGEVEPAGPRLLENSRSSQRHVAITPNSDRRRGNVSRDLRGDGRRGSTCWSSFTSSTTIRSGAAEGRADVEGAGGDALFVLYDEVGGHDLPGSYVNELRRRCGGPASTHPGDANRFNSIPQPSQSCHFDGRTAFVGGHDVGDEYLGNAVFGASRAAHVKVEGPVVQCVRVAWARTGTGLRRTAP